MESFKKQQAERLAARQAEQAKADAIAAEESARAQFVKDSAAAEAALLTPAERAEEEFLENVLTLYNQIKNAKNGSIGPAELATAMEENPALKRRLVRNLRVAYDESEDTLEELAVRLVAAADGKEVCYGKLSTPGALDWHDLELAIRGWTFLDYRKHPDASRLDREHQLKGAAARAEQARLESGGFAGLLDPEEARAIARRARDLTVNRDALYRESEPEIYPDGAIYRTSGSAATEREAREREIEETLRAEGLLRDEFPGLTEEQAREVIANVKLGGVVVEIEDDEDMKIKKARKLPPKLEELKNSPLKKNPRWIPCW